MASVQSRRRFLAVASMAGGALVAGPRLCYGDAPAETSSVRLPAFLKISDCMIPEYVATGLLREEGLTDVTYVETGTGFDSAEWLRAGQIDFDWNYPPAFLSLLDADVPITVISGMHSGCLELMARNDIKTFSDLKGRRVGIYYQTSAPHTLIILMAAYVGLDAHHDLVWIEDEKVAPVDLFLEGKIDAFLGSPPEPQMVRAKGVGHTILRTSFDRPWSDYYCCALGGSTPFVRNHPAATKRILRALLKSVDLCVSKPELQVQAAVEQGFVGDYEMALQAMSDVKYGVWREYDPEDSLRFYGLRMKEVGLLKSNPNDLVAKGTDWSFLADVKRELKG
jgi:NitT/TauT family transport system substrate-binding protein